jgi:hypothetical protein
MNWGTMLQKGRNRRKAPAGAELDQPGTEFEDGTEFGPLHPGFVGSSWREPTGKVRIVVEAPGDSVSWKRPDSNKLHSCSVAYWSDKAASGFLVLVE